MAGSLIDKYNLISKLHIQVDVNFYSLLTKCQKLMLKKGLVVLNHLNISYMAEKVAVFEIFFSYFKYI